MLKLKLGDLQHFKRDDYEKSVFATAVI